MSNFFRGTNLEQDIRYKDKMKKLRKTMRFPACYKEKVDMEKVQLAVVKPWISHRVTQMLGFPDEIVIDLIFNLLEANQHPDPKEMHIQLTGFLEGKTNPFMAEMWPMLVSAAKNPTGIPKEILDAKKAEILAKYAKNQKEKKRLENAIAKKQDAIKIRSEKDEERSKNSRWDRNDRRDRDDRSRRGRSHRDRDRGRESDKKRDRNRSRSREKDRDDSRERLREGGKDAFGRDVSRDQS